MMTLLGTFNYIPAFIVGLVMIFLSVKVVLLPMADLITKIRDKTTDVAIYPLSVFMGVPAIAVFFVAVSFTVSMFAYMVGLVH